MQLKKKLTKAAAVILSAALAGLFGTAGYYSLRLPSSLTADTAGAVAIAQYPEISSSCTADSATLSLFGAIPVKQVSLRRAEAPVLTAGGMPFGIKLLMDGVMVTGLGNIGELGCPAADAGVEAGDVIRTANGIPLASNAGLQRIIADSGGQDIELCIDRSGCTLTLDLQPVYSESAGTWVGGMWVRDSIAGIGTVTFIDEDGHFGGLGHPVCDCDTGALIPVNSGEAVEVEITDVKRGTPGSPGELHGSFLSSSSFGTLTSNGSCGLFGEMTAPLSGSTESYPLGYRQEISEGEAYIITTVSGEEPVHYAVRIESIDYNAGDTGKDMVIRITDEELIKSTGGIVQGMSGSPVIQDGKLIGAVTHVFVADPTRGYAVFADEMYDKVSS